MSSSLRANVRIVSLLALSCVVVACESPGGMDMGKRDVAVTFQVRDQEAQVTAAVEAASGVDPLAADIYLFDQYQWADFDKSLFDEIAGRRAAGDDAAVADLVAELVTALAPRRVQGAKTKDTLQVPNVPHVFVAVRGQQVGYRKFNALRERVVEIAFD